MYIYKNDTNEQKVEIIRKRFSGTEENSKMELTMNFNFDRNSCAYTRTPIKTMAKCDFYKNYFVKNTINLLVSELCYTYRVTKTATNPHIIATPLTY